MAALPSINPNFNYYPQALLQFMLYQDNLNQVYSLLQEISILKNKISSKQKKHRRCDKDILKEYKCQQCSKIYGSEVALKLHCKIKHKSTDDSTEGIHENYHCESRDEGQVQKIAELN